MVECKIRKAKDNKMYEKKKKKTECEGYCALVFPLKCVYGFCQTNPMCKTTSNPIILCKKRLLYTPYSLSLSHFSTVYSFPPLSPTNLVIHA